MKKLLSYLSVKEWVLLLCFVILIVSQTMLALRMPEYMTDITNMIQNPNSQMSGLVRPGTYMLLCAIGAVICAVVAGLCMALVSTTVTTKLREETFDKIISFSFAEMNQFSSSSLITRCTNDVTKIQNFSAMGIQMMIQGPITAMIAVMKMGSNRTWLMAVFVTVVLIIGILLTVFFISLPKTIKLQRLTDVVNRITREHLSGLRVIHAYNGYDFQKKQFDLVNEEITETNIFVNRTMGLLNPVLPVFVNGLALVIYVLGAVLIQSAGAPEKLTLFSQMIVFESYALQAVSAFVTMLMAIVALPGVIVSYKRILEVLQTKLEIVDGKGEKEVKEKEGTIEFQNVSFTYPGAKAPAISNISFTVNKGEILAIIGSTGSGKTTLMNLIPRMYDVTEGKVLVDGIDVKNYKIKKLREKFGYVPQKSFLFEGTISSNVAYGPKDTFGNILSDVKKATEVGQSKEFIECKEGGYSAHVEEGGSNFSGGQKQRLTISRAICRAPQYYLFDDSFSALDFKTDAVLRKKLHEYAKDATQVIVGQRIGSIMNADKIIVLEKGKMVGLGTHSELLESCDVYKEIAQSQIS